MGGYMKRQLFLAALIVLSLNSIARAQTCDDLGTYNKVDVKICNDGGQLKMFAYNNNKYRVEIDVTGCIVNYESGKIGKIRGMLDHIRPNSGMGAFYMEDVGKNSYELKGCRLNINRY